MSHLSPVLTWLCLIVCELLLVVTNKITLSPTMVISGQNDTAHPNSRVVMHTAETCTGTRVLQEFQELQASPTTRRSGSA